MLGRTCPAIRRIDCPERLSWLLQIRRPVNYDGDGLRSLVTDSSSKDQETGEYDERRLNHSDGEAERFYRELKQREVSVRVGMEAADIPVGLSGYSQNWVSRSGLAMPQRSADSGCASRRPTARMPDCC